MLSEVFVSILELARRTTARKAIGHKHFAYQRAIMGSAWQIIQILQHLRVSGDP